MEVTRVDEDVIKVLAELFKTHGVPEHKQHPAKQRIAMKRRVCSSNPDFLTQVLTGKEA
tara:strand:+ start:2291 stop:2467 length:177 start_codon:yes stop_codon:yes gene_type:complete